MAERVCIFIDGSNFYHQLKESGTNTKIDYGDLSQTLVTPKRKLIRTYYYVCPPTDPTHDSYHDQQKFFSYLKNTPYLQLRFGHIEQRGSTHVEKGIDVQIAVDMIALAYENAYDTAILISNDADLLPAVEHVKQKGKQVEYAYLGRKTILLLESSDLETDIQALI